MTPARRALWALAGLSEPRLTSPNRLRKRLPRSDAAFWCGGCDRDRVHAGLKCKTCGHTDGSVVRMKPHEIG